MYESRSAFLSVMKHSKYGIINHGFCTYVGLK